MIYFHLTFANLQAKLPNLTQQEYTGAFNTVKAKAPTGPDPLIRLDPVGETLEIEYHGEDLRVYYPDFAEALKKAVETLAKPVPQTQSDGKTVDIAHPMTNGGTEQILTNAFGTPEATARKEAILDDSREALRKVPYQDVANPVPPPNPDADDLDNLKAVIASNPNGFCFGGDHADPTRHALMERLLDEPDGGGMGMYFIEELMVVDQRLVDDYLNSPKGTKLPPALVKRIGGFGQLQKVLEKMRDKNADQQDPAKKIKVYGINSNETKIRPGVLGGETRTAMMNLVAKDVIEQARKDNPGKKFMAVIGAQHSNTHAGGIPGLSQMFGVPAVKLEKGGPKRIEVDAEDKTLRGMPTADEMRAIEAKAAKITNITTNDAKRDKIHELSVKERTDLKTRYETLKEAFKEPFISLRSQIVELERIIALDRKKGTLTPQIEQARRQKIARLADEIEQAKKRASDLLKVYARATPDVLKQKDADDMTLLHYAASQANEAAIATIVQAEPSVLDAQTKKGDTAAHLVLQRRDFHGDALRKDLLDAQAAGLEWILGAGADPNIPNAKGEVPLHMAALNGNAAAADNLLSRTADPDVKDARGWTPFDVCLGSTKLEVEKVFYDKGAASPQFLPDSPNPSIVDVLVQVTKFEDPVDATGVREMYEKMYADPLLKPILEAAAVDAMQDRDPPNEGGVRIFITKGDSTGRMFNAPSWLTGGQGAYDEDANTFLLAGKQESPRQGIVIHEMTHMVTRKMYGQDTVPYGDGAEQLEYQTAINKDVQGMHLMSDDDPAEMRIKDRICGRMEEYANRGGDAQLLQEFIVGIPQLISEYGGEVVSKFAPNLMKYYGTFTNKVSAKMRNDPQYQAIHGQLNNDALDLKLQNNPPVLPTAPDNWLPKGGKDSSVDSIMKKVETEFAIRNGTAVLQNGVSFAYSPDKYQVRDSDRDSVNEKMSKVRAGLEKVLAEDGMADEISPDALRALVLETTTLVADRPAGAIEEAISGHATNWVRDTKVRLTERKIEKGQPVSGAELAEAVLLQAEDMARSTFGSDDKTATVEVDESKHKALVKDLAKDLEKILGKMDAQKVQETLPTLISRLSQSMVTSPKSGFSLKKKNVTRDPEHISMDEKRIRKAWLAKLETLKA